MEKKTIGAFIAALRKSNGLTQQEVADRLNISNKAVSRWERDECAPDISLIPALAELLGVTCDELLKGERITAAPSSGKAEPKVEKQISFAVNRALSKFETLMWISIALAVTGIIGMFFISYGFFRPSIGFCLLLLFELASVVMALIAKSKMKETINASEQYDTDVTEWIRKMYDIRGRFLFASFYADISAVLFTLPLLLATQDYMVLSFELYITKYFLPIALILTGVFFILYKPCITLLSEQSTAHERLPMSKTAGMNFIQFGTLIVAGILVIFAPYSQVSTGNNTVEVILITAAIMFLLFNIVSFIVFMVKYNSERRKLLLPGIRNLLLIIPVCLLKGVNGIGYLSSSATGNTAESFVYARPEFLYIAAAVTVVIIFIFNLLMAYKIKKV